MSDDNTRELPPVLPEGEPEGAVVEAPAAEHDEEHDEAHDEAHDVEHDVAATPGQVADVTAEHDEHDEPGTQTAAFTEPPTTNEETDTVTIERPAETTTQLPTTPLPPVAPVPVGLASSGPRYDAPPTAGPATSYAPPTGHIRVTSPTPPAPPAPEPRKTLRVGTVVWGLVVAAVGVGLLSIAWGAHLDAELALIVLLGAAGLALLVGSLVGMRRSRHRLEGRS